MHRQAQTELIDRGWRHFTVLAARAFTTIADTSDVVLVVEGSTLAVILDKDRLVADFLGLAVHAHSVICCRVSPIQKADIVSLVRSGGAGRAR